MKISLIAFVLLLFCACSSYGPGDINAEEMVGHKLQDEKVISEMRKLGDEKELGEYEDCTYHNYKNKGVSVLVNTHDSIRAVFFYSEGSAGYRQYSGKLPENIEFSMTRRNINDKFGKPAAGIGGGEIEYHEIYERPNAVLGLGYKLKDTTDLNNPIKVVSVYAKD